MPISSLRCTVTQNYAGIAQTHEVLKSRSAARSTQAIGPSLVSSAQSSFWARPGRRRGTFASPLPIHISLLGNSFTRTAAKTLASSPFGAPSDFSALLSPRDQISVILSPISMANDGKTNARFIEARVMRKVKVRILPFRVRSQRGSCSLQSLGPNARHNAGLRSCVRFRCCGPPEARMISDDVRGFDPQSFQPIVSSRD